jgi:hypothetical protein
MSVVYTAIFSDYDDLKEPRVVTPGWRYVVFTDQPLKSKVWEVRPFPCMDIGPQRTARYLKILGYNQFTELRSLWIDASFIVNCNLDRWMRRQNGPLTVITHPERKCVYEEILECIRQERGNPEELMRQYLECKNTDMPRNGGLISTGILMRDKVPGVDKFCLAWWEALSSGSVRDQVSFAQTAWRLPGIHSQISWDYRMGMEFLHVPHLHNPHRAHRLKALGIR